MASTNFLAAYTIILSEFAVGTADWLEDLPVATVSAAASGVFSSIFNAFPTATAADPGALPSLVDGLASNLNAATTNGITRPGTLSTIPSPSQTSSNGSTKAPVNPNSPSSGLSRGAKAGIAIGVILAVILIVLLVWIFVVRRKRRYKNVSQAVNEDSYAGASESKNDTKEVITSKANSPSGQGQVYEAMSVPKERPPASELDSSRVHELGNAQMAPRGYAELSSTQRSMSELQIGRAHV